MFYRSLFTPVGNWIPSLQNLGIASVPDPNGGENFGGFVSPVSINPGNWTRSYSKSGYIDPLPPRSNLDILLSNTVTKILFSDISDFGKHVATGVEFASSANAERNVVKVKKEVILAGGALGSPRILLLSGVGPKDVLEAVGIPLVSELPGVGQHLQDHLVGLSLHRFYCVITSHFSKSAPVVWKSQVETAGDLHAVGTNLSVRILYLLL